MSTTICGLLQFVAERSLSKKETYPALTSSPMGLQSDIFRRPVVEEPSLWKHSCSYFFPACLLHVNLINTVQLPRDLYKAAGRQEQGEMTRGALVNMIEALFHSVIGASFISIITSA